MTRRAEDTARGDKQLLNVSGGRLGGKNPTRQWRSREGIENDGDLEMKEVEQTGDVRQVRQPDVVPVLGPNRPSTSWHAGGSRWGGSLRTRRTVSEESFHPARARVWAMR